MDILDYPVLEYDKDLDPIIDPFKMGLSSFDTDKLVITFFPDSIKTLLDASLIQYECTISGENPIDIYRFTDAPVLITLGQVGCPACGGNLDYFTAMGIHKVMFCGGGGVLDKDMPVGSLLLVEGAIRDEGFSYQYLPPSRCVYNDKEVTDLLAAALDRKGVAYERGLCWTTDAIFRETKARIKARKAEGARIVEMEQSGCLAVAQYRGIRYGALIYGGDDVSQEDWNNRAWRSREGIRYDMVQLCKELTLLL